ncbi:MAG TPA: fused MFS/spermidine synthase [Methylomirabilota bacterium]|jgi:SAM-dependent methyltransferase|nr:fused MFS/spermidine synthase [Methylomirabilota bacterium]
MLTVILLLYSATLFVGATLLFVVQPMVGKMILPLLGGTPAVWNTCMVFFQAALVGGYAYAHASTAWLGVSRQAILHLAVLAVPLAVLPIVVDPGLLRGGEANPVLAVLLLLSLSVGLPFLVVGATAPLLQKWFASTGHPAARDPYFLYAASNLGSMLALLGYPALIEPRLHLTDHGWLSQTRLWSLGYLVLTALTALCALALWRSRATRAAHGGGANGPAAVPAEPGLLEEAWEEGPGRRLVWVALAFVPSSLLLGVTTYITTDIAAVPLLWVLPLAIYLLSFILAFGRWPAPLHRLVVAAAFPVVLVVLFFMVSGFRQRIWVTVLWHLLVLLVVALACHGELALSRPAPRRLTEFYLLISVGGVLGGLFNALVAPAVFNSLAEYPLAMVLAGMLLSARCSASQEPRDLRLLPIGCAVGVGVLALVLYSETATLRVDFAFLARILDLSSERIADWLSPAEVTLNKILVYGPPLMAGFLLRRRPLAFGLALIGVLLVTGYVDARNSEQIRQARSFFGVLRISRDRDDKGYTELRHGTTLHGRQSLEPERRAEPLSYYHRQSPIGQIFAELERRDTAQRVGVIGLGTGTLAAYARPGDAMTFYEIDRLVRDIAFDRSYFTYLADARNRGATVRVELGDARLRLEAVKRERPGERYDLIVIDAFTSDAIPVHLLTREALRLYLDMLKPDGLLAFHISNRYLDLGPVVANLAEDARLGGRLLQHGETVEIKGAAESTWAVLARTPEALASLAGDERWTASELETDPRVGTWTDDFYNLLSIFKWR